MIKGKCHFVSEIRETGSRICSKKEKIVIGKSSLVTIHHQFLDVHTRKIIPERGREFNEEEGR